MKRTFPKSEKHASLDPQTSSARGGNSIFPGGRLGFSDEGEPDDVQPTPGDLRLLSVLLAAPEDGSLPLIEELAQAHDWLIEPTAELAAIKLEDWQAEHTRLFISGYPKTVCPPFESAYRKGDLGAFAADELGDLYRQLRLETVGLPADYLGTILECAAYLMEMPWMAGDGQGAKLWHDHVVDWVPRFARELRNESQLLLYRRLAERLLACITDGPQ